MCILDTCFIKPKQKKKDRRYSTSKTNKKIIDESGFSFDPELENDKVKVAFNNYVDTLVIINCMIEQLQTRLKINTFLSTQFVIELNVIKF
jgi:hypothetical protein